MNNGLLLVLSGPSGVGKNVVLEAWAARNPRVRRIVTMTTREPRPAGADGRPAEVDGVDYYFVPETTFMRMANSGGLLEHKQVHGAWYGSPRPQVERMLAEGLITVLEIDVQGKNEVVQRVPDATTVFMVAPSEAELERRLRQRKTDSEEAIQRRLKNSLEEMTHASEYQHVVVNDTVGNAVNRLEAIASGAG